MKTPALKTTALNATHRQLGARMVNFAGWDMPVQYSGAVKEHMAVRKRAGIFDVSHMGELEIRGSNALETIQKVTCNDASRLAISQCQYSALTAPNGAFVDDLLIYRMDSERFLLCVNASNQEKDYEWIRANASPKTDIIFRSNDYSQLAVQGPKALEILQPLTDIRLADIRYYWFTLGEFAGTEAIVSRTGYTGEDGFEIYCHPSATEAVWSQIMECGSPHGIIPAGLAARNTLRLEAGLLLYGNDMDETTTVLEAGLGWICKLQKESFIGRDALIKQKESGIKRILSGFEMIERGIARDEYPVEKDGKSLGTVTSGSHAPFLKKNIGFVYLPVDLSAPETELRVIIRSKPVKAQVVLTPFYRRTRQTENP